MKFAESIEANACPYCPGAKTSVVNTYKHNWVVCNNCGNAYCKVKNRFSLAFTGNPKLMMNKQFIQSPDTAYSFKNTNQGEIDIVTEQAENLSNEWQHLANIDLKDKKILEISGGNGHFIHYFRKFSNQLWHTEYNSNDVAYVNSKLKLTSRRFDFNSQKLGEVYDEKFDIIVLKGALEFCHDIQGLISGMQSNLSEDGIVIILTCVPTLGNFLCTQFDDYNQQVLYQPKNIEYFFKSAGYSLTYKKNYGDSRREFPLRYYRDKRLRFVMLKYLAMGLFKLPADPRFIHHALDIRGVHLVFKRGEHPLVNRMPKYF